MIRKNIKLLIGIILGIISVGGVYAANSLNASSVTIDKSNMSKVESNTLQSALEFLYSQSEKTNIITIESNVLHLSQTYLGIAYLDPTDLTKKCSSQDAKANRNQDGTITGVKTGCMKWYIYKEDNSNYYAILDHNTTAGVAYNSSNVNTSQKEIADALVIDTAGWGTKGEEVINLNPRLITADEIASIVGANWDSSTATVDDKFYFDSKGLSSVSGQGKSNYAFLFDNLGWNDQWGNSTTYGGNEWDGVNVAGYWTDNLVNESGIYVWSVDRTGNLYYNNASGVNRGLRPVITIPKSLFN